MIEQLFGSKTRVKLLQLFYSNPNRSFYVREITRKIDEQINSVRRELANLLSIGIISSDTNNNRLYYEVDQKYEYYSELSIIFGKGVKPTAKAAKAAVPAENTEINSLGHVELAIYTGQFTRDETGGIDFLVVGDINQTKLSNYVSDLEAKEGKEIRYTSMPLGEYKYRKQVNDRFLSNVLNSKMQILVDKQFLLTPKPDNKKSKEEE
ncbi:MAG TPA: transcriptional regulator [Candidatus Saccharimonadales bacterium]|nr:transcriptional regulator [Candidatus Saccharimonadales bacterium]